MQNNELGFFRRTEVEALTGLSANTIDRMCDRGEFPKPVQIAPRAIGWKRADIRAWQDSRPLANTAPVPRKAVV